MNDTETTGLLETRGLTHRFPDGTRGLNTVDLSLPFDELIVVTGSNGAGKSLLARHLVGLTRPTGGRVLLNGTDIRSLDFELHTQVAYVFQDAEHQVIGQTVREDLAFGPIHRGLDHADIQERVEQLLDRFHLQPHADADPRTLSGGELRRLAVAGVVITGARYVIMDEPFSSLDPRGVREVLHAILRLREYGYGAMVITHELEKILAHADRLVILDTGRVQADGRPDEIVAELTRFDLRRPPGPIEAMTWLP